MIFIYFYHPIVKYTKQPCMRVWMGGGGGRGGGLEFSNQ